MELLRNLLSSFLITLIIPVLTIYLLALNFSSAVFNTDNFNAVLNQNQTYQKLSVQIIPGAIIELTTDQPAHIGLPKSVFKNLVAKSIDKTKLESDLKKVVTQTHDYLTSQTDHLNTKVDLTPYTTNFRDNLKPAVKDYLDSLAPCSPAKEAALAQNVSLPDCKSTKETSDQILTQLGLDQFENNTFNQLPKSLIISEDRLSFDTALSANSNQSSVQKNSAGSTTILKEIRKQLAFESQLEKFLLLGLLVLFVLLIGSRLKSLSSIFKWVSSALFSATVLPLFILVTILNVFNLPQVIGKQVAASNVPTESGKLAIQLLVANLETFIVKILQGLEIQYLLLFAIGLILLVARFFLTKKEAKKQTIVLTQQTNIP